MNRTGIAVRCFWPPESVIRVRHQRSVLVRKILNLWRRCGGFCCGVDVLIAGIVFAEQYFRGRFPLNRKVSCGTKPILRRRNSRGIRRTGYRR